MQLFFSNPNIFQNVIDDGERWQDTSMMKKGVQAKSDRFLFLHPIFLTQIGLFQLLFG